MEKLSTKDNYRDLRVLAFFGLFLACGQTSANYSKSYDGYNLTIRDNAGNQWATLAGAQDWCRTNLNGSSLASVSDSDHQSNIMQFGNDSISAGALSENDIILNAQFILTDFQWLNGQSLTADTDVQGQAVESQYLLYAYLLTRSFSLMASKPTDRRSYLCQYLGDSSSCRGIGFSFQGRCYRKYDDPKVSWFDARINCRKDGGDLASFDYLNRDTLSTLNSSALYPATSTDYWIGLKRLKWKWLDTGIETVFTYWLDDHPSDYSKKCICLGTRNLYAWKWLECDCNQNHQFICLTVLSGNQISTPPSTAIKPATTTLNGISSTLHRFSATLATIDDSTQSVVAPRVGLAVGLGVGLPLAVVIAILGILLAWKTKQFRKNVSRGACDRTSKTTLSTNKDQRLGETDSERPERDAGKAVLGGAIVVGTDAEVVNPYEMLKDHNGNRNHLYQELSGHDAVHK